MLPLVSDHEPTPHARPSTLACVGCGYDLAGLPEGGRCPECTRSIAESRRLSLPRAPVRFRRGLRIAATLALTTLPLIGVQFGMTCVTWYRYMMAGGSFWPTSLFLRYGPWAIGLVVNLLWLISIWLATAPTPAIDVRRGPRRIRRGLRTLLVSLTLVVVTSLAWASVAWVPRWLAMHAGFALYHVLTPVHLLNLARRTGRPDLERRARRACVLVPLLAAPSTVLWPASVVIDWAPLFAPGDTRAMAAWWVCKLGPDVAIFAATAVIFLTLRAITKSAAGTPAPTAASGTA